MATIISQSSPVARLQRILGHVHGPDTRRQDESLSIVHGSTSPQLLDITLGELLHIQSLRYHESEFLIFSSTNTRWTYGRLEEESSRLSRGLIAKGISAGDRVSIMAGNCEEYVALFFAVVRIGAILVVVNNTYTLPELLYALKHTESKLLLLSPQIGTRSLEDILTHLNASSELQKQFPNLKETIVLQNGHPNFGTYHDVVEAGKSIEPRELFSYQEKVKPADVCNLQFTSGSTGNPKAAMLTHHNLVNNSRFIGDRMDLTSIDVLCCPPPLFHCFGLVLGMLACLSHGSKIVFPSDTFSPQAVVEALGTESCTALHGVPTMFECILSLARSTNLDLSLSPLRTGIVAGAPVPQPLMERMLRDLGMWEFTSSYGLTEASPTCFNALTTDSITRRLTTVGKVMPHASAKIIDPKTGKIVPVGERGELCMAGYQIMNGYWENSSKTKEALIIDDDGTVWLRTGDEAVFDAEGYCSITGRFKDIIIRGGENIYPLEIEERLVAHVSVRQAAVVGVPDERYGEIVVAFLVPEDDRTGSPTDEIQEWCAKTLGRHKVPKHVFWLDGSEGRIMPQTGSGKIQKHILRDLGKKQLGLSDVK